MEADLGGDEDEGRGGTPRRLVNRLAEAVAQRRTGRVPTATTGAILRESGPGRALARLARNVRGRRGRRAAAVA